MITVQYPIHVGHETLWEGSADRRDKIENKLLDVPAEDISLFHGNAACYPYFSGWCHTKAEAEKAEKEVRKILKQHRVKLDP